MLFVLWVGVALAGPPMAVVTGDEVIGTVSVRAAPDVARARVSDPAWISATEAGGSTSTVAGRDGSCLLIDNVSPSAFLEVRYRIRQCPTSDGVKATMVTSNAFETYTTSWRVTPEGTGSLVEYRLRMVTKLMLPQSFVYGTVKKRIQGLMERIQGKLGAP